MNEKRRDNKGRVLKNGESQRKNGRYLYKYVDAFGETKCVYSWKLVATDSVPKDNEEPPNATADSHRRLCRFPISQSKGQMCIRDSPAYEH